MKLAVISSSDLRFRWSADDCFQLMKAHGVKPNPLYLLGAKRVGCFPCIHVSQRELKALLQATPELKPRLIQLERKVNEAAGSSKEDGNYHSFFRSDEIPQRFCSVEVQTKDGRTVRVPTAEDVFSYIESVDRDQIPLLPARSCMSVYRLCE